MKLREVNYSRAKNLARTLIKAGISVIIKAPDGIISTLTVLRRAVCWCCSVCGNRSEPIPDSQGFVQKHNVLPVVVEEGRQKSLSGPRETPRHLMIPLLNFTINIWGLTQMVLHLDQIWSLGVIWNPSLPLEPQLHPEECLKFQLLWHLSYGGRSGHSNSCLSNIMSRLLQCAASRTVFVLVACLWFCSVTSSFLLMSPTGVFLFFVLIVNLTLFIFNIFLFYMYHFILAWHTLMVP